MTPEQRNRLEDLADEVSEGNEEDFDASSIRAALARVDALQRFKEYVHKRLDDAGVPVDPESPHKAEGCRIGGRLDWLFAERHRDIGRLNRIAAELVAHDQRGYFVGVKAFVDAVRAALSPTQPAPAGEKPPCPVCGDDDEGGHVPGCYWEKAP
jgi:hypothetical protein